MIEKQYFGEEKMVALSQSELQSMLAEAKASASESLMRENKRLKEVLKAVNVIIGIISDD